MNSEKEFIKDIPRLAKEFDTENNSFPIDNITTGSNKPVNWVCERGHKWTIAPWNRKSGSNCPYCGGRIPIKGETDLVTCYPDVAKQWHPTKNDGLKPEDFKPRSNKKVWWLCPQGHEYMTSIDKRTTSGGGCPYCAGNIPIKGETDLVTCYPDVAKQWHPTKNDDLKPEDFKPQSNKKVWWMCPQGHEYEAVISTRTVRKQRCPYCTGRNAIKGKTDLETLRPDIAKEWHPIKNGDTKPNAVTVGSNSKCWWMCPKGHEYKMMIRERTRKDKRGCPYCAGKKPIPGQTDLGTVCKESYQFWDFDKNDITPSEHLPRSCERVWMRCDKGHSWKIKLVVFTRRPKCPYCSGTILEKGVNTLRALYPDVAKKWDYKKNASIDIDTVHLGSSMKQYWWKCDEGHSWITNVDYMVKSRKQKSKGCPYCSGSISKYSI